VERELRRGDRPGLALGIVESFALHEQRRAMELEPRFEHLALVEQERRLGSTGVNEVFDHDVSLWP
jgi:hypothetical protein